LSESVRAKFSVSWVVRQRVSHQASNRKRPMAVGAEPVAQHDK